MKVSNIIIDYIKSNLKLNPDHLVVTGPDVGSADKARHYSKKLGAELAIVYKAKSYEGVGKVEEMKLVGDVKNKDVVIVDDMISTGGTLLSAINLLRDKGAEKIYVATSLPFFNGKCVERLHKAYEDKLLELAIGTDAVFHGEEFVNSTPWYREVSIAPLFARVIYNINKKRSVSELLK